MVHIADINDNIKVCILSDLKHLWPNPSGWETISTYSCGLGVTSKKSGNSLFGNKDGGSLRGWNSCCSIFQSPVRLFEPSVSPLPNTFQRMTSKMVLCIKSSGPSDYLSPPSPRRCVFPLVIVSFFPTFTIYIFKDSFLNFQ